MDSAFASTFDVPWPDELAQAQAPPATRSPPSRVLGFPEAQGPPLGAPERPAACSPAERQGSVGGLSLSLFRAASLQQEEGPRPRLSIATTRSLKLTKFKRVQRADGGAAAAPPAGGHGVCFAAPADVLGSTAPSRGPLAAAGMARACSGHIDMPPRLARAMTAPDGLEDDIIAAAITSGPMRSQNHSPSPGAAAAAAAAATRPGNGSRLQTVGEMNLAPARSASNDSQSSGQSGANGRPPMPVTPGFAPTRPGSGGRQQQQRGAAAASAASSAQRLSSTSSYKELFDAQAETAMAHAQVNGLQEALRRKNEEVERLQQELLKVAAERDALKESAAASTAAALPAGSTFAPLTGYCGGHGHSPSRRPLAAGAPGAPGAAAAAAAAGPAGPLPRIGVVCVPRKCSGGSGGGRVVLQTQEQQGPAASPFKPDLQGGTKHAQQQGQPFGEAQPQLPVPTMVSAFANHALPFSFD